MVTADPCLHVQQEPPKAGLIFEDFGAESGADQEACLGNLVEGLRKGIVVQFPNLNHLQAKLISLTGKGGICMQMVSVPIGRLFPLGREQGVGGSVDSQGKIVDLETWLDQQAAPLREKLLKHRTTLGKLREKALGAVEVLARG